MPTVQEIHEVGPVAIVLASNDIANGALYGARPNANLPIQLELIRYVVDDLYEQEDIDNGGIPSGMLTLISNYFFSWMGMYGIIGLNEISSGGVIPNPDAPTIQYGLPITYFYTAAVDGEYILNIKTETGTNLPQGAKVIFVQKGGGQPLATTSYNYISPNLVLLGGIIMGAEEVLTYQYVLPIYGAPAPPINTNSYILINSSDFLLINSTDKFII